MPKAFLLRFQFDLRSFIIAFPTEISLTITNGFSSLEKPPREIALLSARLHSSEIFAGKICGLRILHLRCFNTKSSAEMHQASFIMVKAVN